jgi:hypothetical protein
VTKREKAKDARLRREFHITLAQFKEVLKFQGGGCAICKNKLNKKGKPLLLAVDHRHKDGLVRGLLCWPCNKAIAILQDSVARAYEAYKYLDNPPFTQVKGETFTAPGRVGTIARRKLLVAFNAAREGNGSQKEQKRKRAKGRKVQKSV